MIAPDFHTAILGQTGSGKTYGAQQIARDLRRRGVGVIALHKHSEPWPADAVAWQTDSPERFAAMYWRCRSVAAFMELADADVSRFDGDFHRMFTRGRHLGIHNFYLSQRAALVHPNIRENCASLLLFSVGAKAAALWAEEMSDLALRDAEIPASILPPQIAANAERPRGATGLPRHWFFYKANRFTPARLMKFSA